MQRDGRLSNQELADRVSLSPSPCLRRVRRLEEQGFNTIAPFYGPVRPQFLSAEAQLASLIAPGVAAFASLPGATCVPAALDLLF